MTTERQIEAAADKFERWHRNSCYPDAMRAEALLAAKAILEAAEAAAWQDISTAPNDGVPADLWVEHWSRDPWIERNCLWSGQNWIGSDNRIVDYDDGCGKWIRPTKWRPLPAPPKV